MSTEYQLILMNGKIIHILYPSLGTRAVCLMMQVKLEPTISNSPRSLKPRLQTPSVLFSADPFVPSAPV